MKKTALFVALILSGALACGTAFAYDFAAEREKAMAWVDALRVRDGVRYDWVAVTETATYGYTYDNALAIIAYTSLGDLANANALLGFLSRYQLPDGSFYDSMFQADGQGRNATRSSGNQAWALYAIAFYTHQTGDASYLSAAGRVADWLVARQDPADGGITGGVNANGSERHWTSTEHNVGAYFALKLYSLVAGDGYYLNAADRCKGWLLTVGWNAAERRFNTGENDPSKFLDAQSLGSIFLNDVGEFEMQKAVLKYAQRYFRTRKTFRGPVEAARILRRRFRIFRAAWGKPLRQTYNGYEYESKDGSFWWEGTEQMAVAWGRMGVTNRERDYINQILTSDDPDKPGSDNDGDGGFQYALEGGTHQLGTLEQPSPGLWFIFAVNDYLGDTPTVFYPTAN